MMSKKIFYFFILLVPTLYFFTKKDAFSPHHSVDEKLQTGITQVQSYILYDECDPNQGCNLTFPSKIETNKVNLTILSITLNKPSLLQDIPGTVPEHWYDQVLNCTTNGTQISCPHFRPIAHNFSILGSINDEDIIIDITVENHQPKLFQSCDHAHCGQFGTTVQRIFDCSQKVENYAGFGDGAGGFTPFVSGDNPDKNWFLVSSDGSGKDRCFWLSPKMDKSNPAAQKDEFDTNQVPMMIYAQSPMTQGRFLWSGKTSQRYDFFEANGYNPLQSSEPSYAYYKFIAKDSDKITPYNGPIYNPNYKPWFPFFYDIISVQYAPQWSSIKYSESLCENGFIESELLSGEAYHWQMPSYPMLMTLTGGADKSDKRNAVCEDNGRDVTQKSLCNGGEEILGFRAVDEIPNFNLKILINPPPYTPKDNAFWSSSLLSLGYGAIFSEELGNVPATFLNTPYPIRCVSATW